MRGRNDSLSAMLALAGRTREIEQNERDEAALLIRGQGFAMYCGDAGAPAIRCETMAAFALAQRGCA